MSDYCTSSDEEFESADEGEEELSSNNDSSSSVIAAKPVLESLNQLAISSEEECQDEKSKEEKEISSPSHETPVSPEDMVSETGWEVLEDDENIEEDVKCTSVETRTPRDVKDSQDLEETVQAENQQNERAAEDHQDAALPDFKPDVKSRSVGRTSSRTKPSLGAKKFGAVKLARETAFENEELTSASNPAPSKSAPVVQQSQETNESNSWGWFAPPKSILSSVTSLTTQILSTVESGLNIPEPEELAKEDLELEDTEVTEKKEITEQNNVQTESKGLGFGLFGGVSNLTKLVESTSTSLFATGLDTLETIGKKTINVLQQTDPGFKKTRTVFTNPLASQERVCLSQALREAKDVNESKVVEPTPSSPAVPPAVTLNSLIERHHGTSHMEALQMLSQQWNTRVAPQVRRLPTQRRLVFEQVAKICSSETIEAEEEDCSPDDFDPQQLEENLTSLLDRASLIVPSQKFIEAVREGILDDDHDPENAYANALDSLALVTSRGIELLRKSGELLLMMPKPANPVAGAKLEAEALCQIANLMLAEITRLGNRHAALVISNNEKGSSTDIFYECANCRLLIQDALKLLIPILQSRVV